MASPKWGVFEGRLRAGVTEQPADGEHGLALSQSDAGVRMAEVVETNIPKIRLGAEPSPEVVQPDVRRRASRPARGKHPAAVPFQPIEHPAGGLGQPDGSRPGFAVAEEQVPLAVVRPAERQDLTLAASGEKEKAHDRHLLRMPPLVGRQSRREAADLIVRQEALAPFAAVAPEAQTGIGALRPESHRLGLAHDDGEHRHRPVGRHRRGAQRGEPVGNVLPVDIGDLAPREMGQKLVPEIAPVDIEGSRLPDALVTLERGLRDSLEEGLSRLAWQLLPEVDRGDDFHRPRARLAYIHGCGVAHDLPDAFATVLAMDEEALASGGQDAEAEAAQLAVTDIVGDLAGLERADAGVGEVGSRHVFSPGCGCNQGTGSRPIRPDATIVRRENDAVSYS